MVDLMICMHVGRCSGHIGPFGLHDWTDRGQRSNGAFAAVPFIEYFEHTGNVSWLRSTGNVFVNEIASFYTSYMVREEDSGVGTAWLAWPRVLGSLPRPTMTCPAHTLGAKTAPYCIVPKDQAGLICHALPNCTGIAYTSDAPWNKMCAPIPRVRAYGATSHEVD